jgi:alpha-ketoglutarate-dependent taurine dioxygenase
MLSEYLFETPIHLIVPEQLYFDESIKKIMVSDKQNNKISVNQFILELHQEEILSIPFRTMSKMIETCRILNDLRTIFIGHDKRLLTLLCQESFTKRYLSIEHSNILKNRLMFTILTTALNDSKLRENLLGNKDNWLIKPSLFGKGKGIIFGKNLNQNEWKNILIKLSNTNEFVVQEYSKQEKFVLNHKNLLSYYNLVGTLLCFNDKFLGPGIYRASNQDLIALTQGGFIIFPLQKAKAHYRTLQIKPEFIFDFCNRKIMVDEADAIKETLIQNGIVLINIKFNDQKSEFLLDLIEKMDMFPYSHSKKGDDFVWDIRPFTSNNSNNPRSYTSEEFSMHTDASFEKIPPRYFGLQVLKQDIYGGGKSLFIRLEEVLSLLDQKEINLLATTKIKMKIPQEFIKNEKEKFTYGTIISQISDKLCHRLVRFRKDVLLDIKNQSEEFCNTLNKFESLIDLNSANNLIRCLELRKNQIILVDNSRFLHARTKILDNKRHLKRIRFQTKDKSYLPWNFDV